MMLESLVEYMLASAEAAYEDPGQQMPMGFMASGGQFYGVNASNWVDQKQPSFTSSTYSYTTN